MCLDSGADILPSEQSVRGASRPSLLPFPSAESHAVCGRAGCGTVPLSSCPEATDSSLDSSLCPGTGGAHGRLGKPATRGVQFSSVSRLHNVPGLGLTLLLQEEQEGEECFLCIN